MWNEVLKQIDSAHTPQSSVVGTGMSLHAHTLQKKPTSVQK
ncbi:MAG: hypothetical protein Q8R83_02185 [Legionellaceae bacterium]|nr:hypothetical protein [Legionellaceae bacterium]